MEDNYFTILWWVFAIHQYELAIGIHCNFYPESSFHLPPHSIPPSCHRALVLGALYLTSNYHRLSILHMVIYMFQGYSPKSSHPPLPLREKSILYVCVSFAALKAPCDLISKQHEVALFSVCWISLYYILTNVLHNKLTYTLRANSFLNLCNGQEITENFKTGKDNLISNICDWKWKFIVVSC